MCMFSEPVVYVGSTAIFATDGTGNRQHLVYSMDVGLAAPAAMVLPLPVPAGSGDDAVRFVDLSGYPELFDDLASGFPQPLEAMEVSFELGELAAAAPLVVHDVGDFEASYVPSHADWGRLDPRFRLEPSVWDQLPGYRADGFAVFQLKPTAAARQRVHPMAQTFPRRDPSTLFFPTVHVHDGELHEWAEFDHALYCQVPGGGDPPPADEGDLPWQRSDSRVRDFADPGRAGGLLHPDRRCWRTLLHGLRPNRDTRLAVGPG